MRASRLYAVLIGLLLLAAACQTAHDRSDPRPEVTARISGLARSLLGSEADVYLDPVQSASGDVLPRWRTEKDGSRRTITIHFESPENPAQHGAGYRRAVNEAVSQWTAVTGVALRFREVPGPEDADVTIEWVPKLGADCHGLAVWVMDANGWIASASLTLALLDRRGNPVDAELARRIALHEVGHLIGLPHSDDERDMMSRKSKQIRLSERDRATAQLLYATEPRVLQDQETGPHMVEGDQQRRRGGT